ncbi:MAG: cation diffusion facilitator family transporter, partial [Xanthomonadales bacterium]|nr:cation diffusion facilitator family transporter [Xanthomonadales bacterium]
MSTNATPHPHTHEHGHDHGVSANADKRYLCIALGLLLAFMGVEIVLGILASSLALISDAGHMLTDAAALGLALFATAAASKPARGSFTWGFKRVEILSAQANGITLLLLAAWFIFEGVQRLIEPPPVHGALVFWTAVAG